MARRIYYYLLPFSKKTKKVVVTTGDQSHGTDELTIRYAEDDRESITLNINGQTIKLTAEQSHGPLWVETFTTLPRRYGFTTLKVTYPEGVLFSLTIIPLPRLDRELKRYQTCLAMQDAMTNGLNSKEKYEAENILERWLLALANDRSEGSVDQIFGWTKISRDSYAQNIKTEDELKKKRITGYWQRFQAILNLQADYLESLRNEGPWSLAPFTLQNGMLHIGQVQLTIPAERAALLLAHNKSEYDLVVMMTRYACLLSRGQQWSIPRRIYKWLFDNYGLEVEGFASPLNSQILTLGSASTSFCSLFFDTDETYGSLGDFFTVPDQTLRHKRVLLNPPFVPSILERMTDRVAFLAEYTDFFVLVPQWTDAPFYRRLQGFTQKQLDFSLEPGSYYFVNLEGQHVPANFASHFFVFSGNRETKARISKLESEIKGIYKQ